MQILGFDSPQANPPVSPPGSDGGQSVLNDPFLTSPTSNKLKPNFFACNSPGLFLSAVAQSPAPTVRSAGSEVHLKAIQAALSSIGLTNTTPGHQDSSDIARRKMVTGVHTPNEHCKDPFTVAISPGQEGYPIFILDTQTPGRQANPIIIPVTPTPF